MIAALHSGWKGAYKKIVVRIVKYLLKKGSDLNSLYFVIGPSIAQKNYEVGRDFKAKFAKQNNKNRKYFKTIRKRIKLAEELRQKILMEQVVHYLLQ